MLSQALFGGDKQMKPPRGSSTLSFPPPGRDMHVTSYSKTSPGIVGRVQGKKTQYHRTTTNVGNPKGGDTTRVTTEKVPRRKGGGEREVSRKTLS